MKKSAIALCLASVASAYGCATATRTPDASSTVRVEGYAEGYFPAGTRLVAPLIVAAEGGIELRGAELTPEARAKFLEERAARIAQRRQAQRSRGESVRLSDVTPGDVGQVCLQLALATAGVGLPLCPIALVGGIVTAEVFTGVKHGVKRGVRYMRASRGEPSLRLEADHAERIAIALRARATSAALVERALYTAPAGFFEAGQAESLLVVRMRAAQTCQTLYAVAAICLVAEAQAFLGDGVALTPTEHVFVHGPLAALGAEGGHVEHTIDQAMELLAENIVAAYTGGGPAINVALEEAARGQVSSRGTNERGEQ